MARRTPWRRVSSAKESRKRGVASQENPRTIAVDCRRSFTAKATSVTIARWPLDRLETNRERACETFADSHLSTLNPSSAARFIRSSARVIRGSCFNLSRAICTLREKLINRVMGAICACHAWKIIPRPVKYVTLETRRLERTLFREVTARIASKQRGFLLIRNCGSAWPFKGIFPRRNRAHVNHWEQPGLLNRLRDQGRPRAFLASTSEKCKSRLFLKHARISRLTKCQPA